MTINAAIENYITAISESPEIEDMDMMELLESEGATKSVAERTIRFVPVAFGRKLLEDLGVTFSNEFVRVDAHGKILSTGKLSEDEVFNASLAATDTCSSSNALEAIPLMSPEVNAVNTALNAGSNPTDLLLGPVTIFDEHPTDAGLQRMQNEMAAQLQADHGEPQPSAKPWWKFW